MASNFLLPLRVVQAVFAIIVLGLIADFVSWFSDAPSSSDFLLFTSIWTLLALTYLVLAPWRFAYYAHKFAVLAVEAVTVIFWFCAWIAVAAWLGDHDCHSGNPCAVGTAAAVFAAFEWVTFLATTIIAAMHVHRTRGTHDTAPPPQMQEGV